MTIDVKIPEFSESISEGTIGTWVKKAGDTVAEGETLVEIETDKVVLEIPAPASGVLEKIIKSENEVVKSLEVVALLAESEAVSHNTPEPQAPKNDDTDAGNSKENGIENKKTSPAVRKLISEHNLNITDISASGKNNRITKEDVLNAANNIEAPPLTIDVKREVTVNKEKDQRVPMSSLRKQIANRLVSAQQEYAMLTTFNQVNMGEILSIRKKFKDQFEEQYGTKLGFMSFFVLAAVEALKEYPIVNASVEDNDIVYHQYVDMGIAVSSERGLVVPVIRNADEKSFSTIETEISELAGKARNNSLTIDELIGGTFTITNGGVFGSMMSTPIVNPPQSAILGMHAIEKRPIVENDEIKIASMMYLALSYDHRIIDGREAVLFLTRIKKIIENPIQLLLHL